jgi:hypothetical protein
LRTKGDIRLRHLRLMYHVLTAQVVIALFILIKVLAVPFLVWRLLGTSATAMVALDVVTIVLGTAMALTMGIVGYMHARHFHPWHPFREAVVYTVCIHGLLALFLLYKWEFGAAWDTELLLLLSGWASMISHPMHLVGFYGQWVDGVALLAMAGCYLLGVVVYHDEQRHAPQEPMNLSPLRAKGR